MINLVVRRAMPLVALAVTLVALTRGSSGQIGDNDSYFHLRFGAEFLSGSWSLWDPGSPTSFSTASWTPTQWLPQIAMAWAESLGGLTAVTWLIRLLTLLLLFALFNLARRYADPLAAAGATLVAVIALAPALTARPQVLSYLFMAVVVSQWFKASTSGRPPWLLVPMTWLWAMCHGMWPLGIIFGIVMVAGLALDGRLDRSSWWRHALVPVLSAVAAAATPIGPALYRGVLAVTSRTSVVAEWGPPELTAPYGIALLVLGALALLHMLRQSSPWHDVLVVGFALALGIYSIRTVPIAAVILVPHAARALQALVGEPLPRPRWETAVMGVFVASGVIAFTIAALVSPTQPRPTPGWLDERLDALESGTPILNQPGWDGYLMWRHPQVDPMVHGYVQIYRTDELEPTLAMVYLEPEGDEHIADSDVSHALLESGSALAYALVKDGWTRAETSEELVLLLAPGADR